MKKAIFVIMVLSSCSEDKVDVSNAEVKSEVQSLINLNVEKIREFEIQEKKSSFLGLNQSQTGTEEEKSVNISEETKENTSVKPQSLKVSNINSEYNRLYDEALSLCLNGNLNQSLTKINQAIEINSKSADAFYIRGNIYEKKEYYYVALDEYLKAVELNPSHVDATSKCAIMYSKIENNAMACVYMRKACDLGSSTACKMLKQLCN